jgi:hypothetical protein
VSARIEWKDQEATTVGGGAGPSQFESLCSCSQGDRPVRCPVPVPVRHCGLPSSIAVLTLLQGPASGGACELRAGSFHVAEVMCRAHVDSCVSRPAKYQAPGDLIQLDEKSGLCRKSTPTYGTQVGKVDPAGAYTSS